MQILLLADDPNEISFGSMKYLTSLTNKGNGGKQRRQDGTQGSVYFPVFRGRILTASNLSVVPSIIFSKFWNQITISTKQKLSSLVSHPRTRVSVFPF